MIIENSGFVRVVDLDELADAASAKLISDAMLVNALHKLDKLLKTYIMGHLTNILIPLTNMKQTYTNSMSASY